MKPMKGKLLCAALALLLFLQTGCAGQQSRETVPVGNLQESVDLLTEELEALDAPPAQDLGLPVPARNRWHTMRVWITPTWDGIRMT